MRSEGEEASSSAGEPIAMWREMVAKRRSESKRVTGTVGGRAASREEIVAGVKIRPQPSCIRQSATSGTRPPGRRHDFLRGYKRRRDRRRARRIHSVDGNWSEPDR